MPGLMYLPPAAALRTALSDRELEVLKLLAGGESTTGIADALSLSASTVATYRTRICDKLKLKNNADLTRYALVNCLLL